MAEIINLRGAGKGTGTTALLGARRARLIGGLEIKRAQAGGAGMPYGAWKTAVAPQIIVEVEGINEPLNAIHGLLAGQTIVLHYVSATGNRNLTAKYCTATAVGESQFPPAEGSGPTPLMQITFDIHAGSGISTPAEALVDAVDAGSPPADAALPLVMLVSAARGAAGATPIASALQASLRCRMAKTVGRRNAAGLPTLVAVTSVAPQIGVSVEDVADWHAAVTTASGLEILIVVFQAGAATKTLTAKWATCVESGEGGLKSPEESAPPGRMQLVWDITLGEGVTGPATALVLT